MSTSILSGVGNLPCFPTVFLIVIENKQFLIPYSKNFGGKNVWQKPTIVKLMRKQTLLMGLHQNFFSYQILYCSNATLLHASVSD